MRVAAVDCGTNSLRLLVAEVAPAGAAAGASLVELDRRMEIVRLGEGVDRTGMLDPQALARTEAVLAEYARVVADLGAERVRMVATSATRDAGNREAFVEMVTRVLGVAPDVVSGETEAALSFLGATAGSGQAAQLASPVLVVDIGGGSTELVLGEPGRAPTAARSMDIGCVRLTERHLRGDPPEEAEVAAATADIEAALDDAAATVDLGSARTAVGLAGSVTTVAAAVLGLATYDRHRIHGARLPLGQVRSACRMLLGASRSQRRALGFMHPGRVDVIGGGALVLDRVLARLAVDELVVSEADILDGIALSLATGADPATEGPGRLATRGDLR